VRLQTRTGAILDRSTSNLLNLSTNPPTGAHKMADDQSEQRGINIHFQPEQMAGVYANFANISHSDYEFTVTFARVDHEVDSEEIPGVVVQRVNISPRFMRELIDAMEDNYSKWTTSEGIRNLPEYEGDEPGDIGEETEED
jgi:hypothetical protein